MLKTNILKSQYKTALYGHLIFLSIFFNHCSFAATDVANTITKNSISQNSLIISGKSTDWGLTETEWKRFITLMQGPSGRYYPNLTPLEVLGINADNTNDLKHFAELAAQQEHTKIERELRFNAAFQEAAKRLYENEPIVRPFDFSAYSTVSRQE